MTPVVRMIANALLVLSLLAGAGLAQAPESRPAPGIDPPASAPAEVSRLDGSRFGYEVRRNLVFAQRGQRELTLHLYVPKAPGPHPVAVVIPGGAWRMPTRWISMARRLAQEGIAAAAIEHSLVPFHVHPDQIEDCRRALQYLRHRAQDLDLDPLRIAAVGVSAGGHLAALLGTQDDAADPESDDPVLRASTRPSCVVAFSAPMTFEHEIADPTEATPFQVRLVADFLGTRYPPRPSEIEDYIARARDASPRFHVDAGDVPHLLVHGSADHIVPVVQAQAMAKALEASRVSHQLVVLEDAGHAEFLLRFTSLGALAAALRGEEVPSWWRDTRAFLREHLLAP